MVEVGLSYLDSSALIKLVISESESGALRDYLSVRPRRVTSRIASVEAARAFMRLGVSAADEVSALLADVEQVDLTAEVLREAARLPPPTLRTLDAIHLATALILRPDLEALVTYDSRLADAATAGGLPVVSPR